MNKEALLNHLKEQNKYHTEEALKFERGNNLNVTYHKHVVAANVYTQLMQDIECGEYDD
jgi:hypothetical protein